MHSIIVFVVVAIVAVAAQEYEMHPRVIVDSDPDWYVRVQQQPRYRRDLRDTHDPRYYTYEQRMGNGRVFGTLGQNNNGLYGKAGYEHNLFNNNRGKLDAQAHGTRFLGPNGASSHVGGSLNYQNSNAAASLDVSRQIHGHSTIDASAGGRWPIGKSGGDISAQGFYNQAGGARDYGGRVNLNYPF